MRIKVENPNDETVTLDVNNLEEFTNFIMESYSIDLNCEFMDMIGWDEFDKLDKYGQGDALSDYYIERGKELYEILLNDGKVEFGDMLTITALKEEEE